VSALAIEFYAELVESPENHAGDALSGEPSPVNVSGRVANRDHPEANATSASRPSRQRRIARGSPTSVRNHPIAAACQPVRH